MMKKILLTVLLIGAMKSVNAQSPQKDEVLDAMKRVADWQILHFRDDYTGRGAHHPLHWVNGAFYVGLAKYAEIAGTDDYYNWLKNIGTEHEWMLHKRKYHADDHAVGRMYFALYEKYGDKSMIEPTIEQFKYMTYHPATTSLDWPSPYHHDRWSWCDALFMSPPVWVKVYNETGDQRYLDFLMKEFKATTDFLFDEDESLYYRDQSYMDKEDNGTKIFWGRGNGWVFAGLAQILSDLDPKSEEYAYFLAIYKKMAARLLELQTEKGHWAMSLLGAEFYPTPETSGSSFFTYGLAWGVNNGILKGKKYEKAVIKAWNAMASYITEEGMLGYVQPIGAAPGQAFPDKTQLYGAGAFLSAGYEVYKLVGDK
ncbi:glycoside hydrolase family 88/105 protein [Reichenbachiella ulvae]|uniref:Glycoside hydrolase family 88 protein n=1 Tax=Reichenbachiella ulvae TaxID=2980104 RepID=A0ABT3CSM4_9BACT|nr:glycoside hydrolase family 88 protein [Reichenbachiella ulvae]MCV9386682.1 glycoside hydrolase family 88 protein [Reichenbachiella ulvae]